MKNTFYRFAAALSLMCYWSVTLAQTNNGYISYVEKAPFKMSVPVLPTFPNKEFNIESYAAVPDGKTLNTAAFAKAIQACYDAGGGVVLVPAGKWLTGPIELKSNINIKTVKGAEILFTPDHKEYPMIRPGNKGKGYVPQSPLYAFNCTNIAITGEGVFDGAGDSWREVKKSKTTPVQWQELLQKGGTLSNDGKVWWPSKEAKEGEDIVKRLSKTDNATAKDYEVARDFLRPYMTFFINCNNVYLQGISLRNSPKFIFYPNRCTNLIIDEVNFYNEWWAQNGDAIDISACKNVIIYKCMVNAGDDGICMKSSDSKSDAVSGEPALQNIVIAECKVFRGHGGFVIGSNTDGGMKNIYVTNCNFNGTDIGIRVKSNKGRGGVVSNIYIENIVMRNIIEEAILFDTYYLNVTAGKTKTDAKEEREDKIPEFKQFYFKNILCNAASTAIKIEGLPEKTVHDINFDNVSIDAKESLLFNYAENINMANMQLNCKNKFQIKNAKNITFNKADISNL